MLTLIPAIDILDGQLVRLVKGDYQQKTVYDQSPINMALYYKSIGLHHIHVVDLNGAAEGSLINLELIKQLSNIPDITIQVGGGIRSISHAKQLFDSGVNKIILGSILIQDFELAKKIILNFPNQVIAGLDVKNNMLSTNGWVNTSSIHITDFISKLDNLPIHAIVSTDISRDGTFSGINESLYQLVASKTSHSIIASGGVNSIRDIFLLKDLDKKNIIGCIVGKAIIEGKIKANDLELLM